MATSLMRWDPAAEFNQLRETMDRLLNNFGRWPAVRDEGLGAHTLAINVRETGDAYVVTAAVPGVKPEDVDVSIEDGVLTIKGEFRWEDNVEEQHYLRRELQYGAFERSLRLPPSVDVDNTEATFENGMLTLRLPKRPEARPRSIKITPKGAIEGKK
ncbi:MAG: Hsp20/alpha crystallin family protein [Dehalococcoidia bacterium]